MKKILMWTYSSFSILSRYLCVVKYIEQYVIYGELLQENMRILHGEFNAVVNSECKAWQSSDIERNLFMNGGAIFVSSFAIKAD